MKQFVLFILLLGLGSHVTSKGENPLSPEEIILNVSEGGDRDTLIPQHN